MKKGISFVLSLAMLLTLTFSSFAANTNTDTRVKNVIFLIPDGQSVGATTLARWYNGGAPLAVDELACGLVRTYSSDAAIADSAPAGTAFATGFKSHTGFVGVLPDQNTMPGMAPIAQGDQRKPVANVLEAAQLAGKATGLVSSSEIMHATPAAFSSHVPSRKDYDSISEQQVYQEIDVMLGAGSDYFAAKRGDNEDLIAEIKNLGYDYVTTRSQLLSSTGNKLWGLFDPVALSYDFDRDVAVQPSLAEMTQKAIDVLKKDQDGFFLMVEGSKVDWASHANDPIGVISDTLAFDAAVKVALDFAKADGNTIIISATDHGNGGITIGNSNTDSTYDKEPLSTYIDPLKKAKLTGEGIEKKLNADRSNVVEVMATYYGISDLTAEEIKAIKETPNGSMNYTVGPMISKRASIGWTTTGHTGEDIPLYVYSPTGDRLTGVVENTDIAKYIATVLGVNLETTTQKLFVQARSGFEAKGATVTWDATDAKNPLIVAQKGNTTVKIPVNKNYALVNGQKVVLDGVSVFNGISSYVPQSAIDLIP